jgi:hypothetical protein
MASTFFTILPHAETFQQAIRLAVIVASFVLCADRRQAVEN